MISEKIYFIEDWRGKKFNHLTIEDYSRRGFLCRCDCGKVSTVKPTFLLSGAIKTCGEKDCPYHKEVLKAMAVTHGGSGTRLYRIYAAMKRRCYKTNDHDYYLYGDRGIKICDEWLNDFGEFRKWAMENGYRDDLSIDRIDVNGNYCPENCRWADAKTQRANQRPRKEWGRRPVMYEIDGIEKTIREWCEEYGVQTQMVWYRMKRKGMTLKDALTVPKHQGKKD